MNIVSSTAGVIAALGFMAAQAAAAGELELRWVKPDGAVVSEKTLTTEELEALPQTTFTTNTPWTTTPTEFSGPALAELAGLGPKASKAAVVAINDYSSEVPAEDWTDHGAILAVRLDGEYMKIRDKGPFWVMYPIDHGQEILNTQLYHSRMVWQVRNIDFVVE